ncbi:hypothetical protein LTR08_003932 [Meristemomyces frigidus]|nr:hypothetical protein LTR08_003932 [Meristemomyces frigidus]
MAPSPWRTLHLANQDLPQLLLKSRLDPTGYTLHLTDLSHIWSETLSRREICRRALNEDCSIDPSDGADQYEILLSKIGEALNHGDGSTQQLRPSPGLQGKGGLVLELTAPLPAPLPALKWRVELSLMPVQHIDTQIISPLLQLAQTQQGQMEALMHELHEKDRVISKITDRLETSGMDLTDVFPGVNAKMRLNRKKAQRVQLARYVSGLGDFDEEAWRQRAAKAVGGGKGLAAEAVDGVMKGLPEADGGDQSGGGLKEWWRELGGGTGDGGRANHAAKTDGGTRHDRQHSANVPQALPNRAKSPAIEDVDMQDRNSDDDFQRQGTPPHLGQHHVEPERGDTQLVPDSFPPEQSPTPVEAEDGSTTEDEDDLDAPPPQNPLKAQQPLQTATPEQPPPPPAQNPCNLRTSTRPRHRSPPIKPQPDSSPPAKPQDSPPANPQERARLSATSGPTPKHPASATPEPPAQTPAKPPRRRKLGAIGGRKAPTPDPPSPTEPGEDDLTTPPPAPSPQTQTKKQGGGSRLGTIGGSRQPANPPPPNPQPSLSGSETSSSSPSAPAPRVPSSPRQPRPPEQQKAKEKEKEPTPPRETSQDRADHKRLELKRQLEDKAQAGAVKKKRRF